MPANLPLPFFLRAGNLAQSSTADPTTNKDFHLDLLSFLSIAREFEVDIIKVTWQPSLGQLGHGATSAIEQAQIDAELNLAFKRSIPYMDETGLDTELLDTERYKALIFELIALESLRRHPNVIDLLGITWETDADAGQVWPVLLTERSELGTLADVLSSELDADMDANVKLKFCFDIAKACKAMHDLGKSIIIPYSSEADEVLKVSFMAISNMRMSSFSLTRGKTLTMIVVNCKRRGANVMLQRSLTLVIAVLVRRTLP
jgi:hypothetical protein